MTTTVQAETDTATRISRRQVLAAIALADAPAPKAVRFRNDGVSFALDVETLAGFRAWAALFSAKADEANPYLRRFTEIETGRPMVTANAYPDWQGWHIYLTATVYADENVEPLDDATRGQLRAVADQPATAGAS